MMKNFKRLVFATCLFFFCKSVVACSIVKYECQATNPCVKIQREGIFYNDDPKYLLLCADALSVNGPKGALIPGQCNKKIEGYKGHRIWTNLSYVSWDALEDREEGDWIEFSMTPHTAFNDNKTPRNRPDQALVSDEKQVYTPSFTTPMLEQFEGFSSNTTVSTPFGPRKIGSLKKGDSVIARDFVTRVWTKTLVLAVNKTKASSKLAKICTQEGIIFAGADQAFYSLKDKKWTKAKDLKSGDLLYKEPLKNDKSKNIDQIILVQDVFLQTQQDQELVSLTLANYYNFCINYGILVHNSMFALLCTMFNGIVCPVFQQLVTNAVVAGYSSRRALTPPTETCNNADFIGRELACTNALGHAGMFGQQPQTYNYTPEQNNTNQNTQKLALAGLAVSIGTGVSITFPGAVLAVAMATVASIMCYKFAEMFIWSRESGATRIAKCQERWRNTFEGIEELKRRRAEIHAKNLENARKQVIGNTLARFQSITREAEALSADRDQEALEWQKAQERTKELRDIHSCIVEPPSTTKVEGCGLPELIPNPEKNPGCQSLLQALGGKIKGCPGGEVMGPKDSVVGCGTGKSEWSPQKGQAPTCNHAAQTSVSSGKGQMVAPRSLADSGSELFPTAFNQDSGDEVDKESGEEYDDGITLTGGAGDQISIPGQEIIPESAINKKRIVFGENANQNYHTTRHLLEEMGLNETPVKNAIRSDLRKVTFVINPGDVYHGEVIVLEQHLYYNAYHRPDTAVITVTRITELARPKTKIGTVTKSNNK